MSQLEAQLKSKTSREDFEQYLETRGSDEHWVTINESSGSLRVKDHDQIKAPRRAYLKRSYSWNDDIGVTFSDFDSTIATSLLNCSLRA